MKRFAYFFICCALFAFSTAYAMEMQGSPGSIYLTDTILNRGADIPTADWDLSEKDYSGSFYFRLAVYTDVLFKNVSRIAVSIDCEPDADHVTNNVFFVKCARKDFVGYTHIDTLTMNRYGGAGVFSNLSSSNKYFLRFDKAEDGIYLSGTFTISD